MTLTHSTLGQQLDRERYERLPVATEPKLKLTDEQLRLELFNAHHTAGCDNCNCAWDAVVRKVRELKEQL